jgi:hypothetical protein
MKAESPGPSRLRSCESCGQLHVCRPSDGHALCEGCRIEVCFDCYNDDCDSPYGIRDGEGIPLCPQCWDELASAGAPGGTTR